MKKKEFDIKSKKSSWTFSNISKNFEQHIAKSVPNYNDWHEIICNLSDNFIDQKNTIFTEIGTSTGLLSRKLINHHQNNKTLKIYSYDIEPTMIEYAKLKNKKHKNLFFICKDVTKARFKKSNCFISYYTIQFIAQKDRQKLIDKIYDSLEWGGGFFLFEKIRGFDARFNDYFNETYNDFKESNGFTDQQIRNKTKSLRGVLDPFSSNGNVQQLKRAGFKDISSIAQWLNFKGWLAIK